MLNIMLLVAFFVSAVLSASGLLWTLFTKRDLLAWQLIIKVAAVLLVFGFGLLMTLTMSVDMAAGLVPETGSAEGTAIDLGRMTSAYIRALALPAGILFFVSLFSIRGDIIKAVRDSFSTAASDPNPPE